MAIPLFQGCALRPCLALFPFKSHIFWNSMPWQGPAYGGGWGLGRRNCFPGVRGGRIENPWGKQEHIASLCFLRVAFPFLRHRHPRTPLFSPLERIERGVMRLSRQWLCCWGWAGRVGRLADSSDTQTALLAGIHSEGKRGRQTGWCQKLLLYCIILFLPSLLSSSINTKASI